LSGKETLPLGRRQRPLRETADVAAGVERLVKSLGRRVAQEDPESLAHLFTLNEALGDAVRLAIEGQRRSGHTDKELGQQLGVSRQAVEQRWPRELPEGDS
jgi:hypothetical protein